MPWVLLLKQGNKKTLQWSWWKANQWNGDCCFCLKRSTGLIFFFMTVMGKIYIISSADPLLGLLLVARKCYILIICVPHVDLTLCNLLLCRGRETKCAYFQGAGPFQPSALRREWQQAHRSSRMHLGAQGFLFLIGEVESGSWAISLEIKSAGTPAEAVWLLPALQAYCFIASASPFCSLLSDFQLQSLTGHPRLSPHLCLLQLLRAFIQQY